MRHPYFLFKRFMISFFHFNCDILFFINSNKGNHMSFGMYLIL